MLRFFARRLRDAQNEEKGFTLIELLVVVIIIGILAAIAIPAYLAQRDRAREAVVESDLRTAGTALNTCLLDLPAASCDTDAELDAYGFNPSADVNRTNPYTVNADGSVTINASHVDNAAITGSYNSGTGRVT